MAKAFGVTVDFLIGEGENASYDKETVERINDIQKMDADTKNVLFNVIDTYIPNFKQKKLVFRMLQPCPKRKRNVCLQPLTILLRQVKFL